MKDNYMDAPPGQMWSIGNHNSYKEYKVFLEEYYGGISFDYDMLEWALSDSKTVILFCRDTQTGYISGSLIAIHQPVKVINEVVENTFVANFMCLASHLRGKGYSKNFGTRLLSILHEVYDKFLVIYNSQIKVEGGYLAETKQYHRHVSLDSMLKYGMTPPILSETHMRLMRKIYDAEKPSFMTRDNIKQLTKNDLKSAMDLLNSRKGSLVKYYTDKTIERLLLKDNIVNTLIHKENDKVTDLVSYYKLKYVLNKDKELYATKIFLLDIATTKYTQEQLVNLVAHCGRSEKSLQLGIIGVNSLDSISRKIRMTELEHPIYYYAVPYKVDMKGMPYLELEEGQLKCINKMGQITPESIKFLPWS